MPVRHFALACAVTVALAACERGAEPPATDATAERAWARAALERNPNLEVVAVDEDAGVFTVRDRRSGAVQAVNASDLAAAPVATLSAAPPQMVDEDLAEPLAAPSKMTDETAEESEPGESPELDYTVEREGGRVRVTGPGISIVSSDTQASPSARDEPGQRAADPFICEGPRLVRFDDRQIFVDGNAVIARDGCELHITNSRIVASGTGLVVRDATVHVTNSHVEGAAGSYDAGPGAKIFLRGVTLKGTLRRDETAEVQELSGRL